MTSEPNCFKEIQIVCLWFSFKCSHSVLCCVPRRIIIVSFEFTFCLFRFLYEMSTRLRESVEWNCENEFRDQVKLQRTTQRKDSVLVVVDKFSTKYIFFFILCVKFASCIAYFLPNGNRKESSKWINPVISMIWFDFVSFAALSKWLCTINLKIPRFATEFTLMDRKFQWPIYARKLSSKSSWAISRTSAWKSQMHKQKMVSFCSLQIEIYHFL